MKKMINSLFCGRSSISWRRLTMCLGLQVFSGCALWYGKLDATTWAYFAGTIAGMYVGGDTGQKIAQIFGSGQIEDKDGHRTDSSTSL